MNEPTVRVLVFDVMETLVREPFYREVPEFFGMSLGQLIEAKDPEAWIRFENGEIDEARFLETFFTDRRAFDHQGFRATFQRSYAWIDGMESLLAELKALGVQMHILSNYPVWYRWIEERLQVSRYLPWTFVSSETKVRKPTAEAFRGVATRLGVPPGDLVLIDDRPENCRGARECGWEAVRFTTANALRSELFDHVLRPRDRELGA